MPWILLSFSPLQCLPKGQLKRFSPYVFVFDLLFEDTLKMSDVLAGPSPCGIYRILKDAQCKKKLKWGNTVFFIGLIHRINVVRSMFTSRQLRGKLLIKCQLDPLNVVAQLDGWSQLQVHTLLHCWKVQQQQRLSINLLKKHLFIWDSLS